MLSRQSGLNNVLNQEPQPILASVHSKTSLLLKEDADEPARDQVAVPEEEKVAPEEPMS